MFVLFGLFLNVYLHQVLTLTSSFLFPQLMQRIRIALSEAAVDVEMRRVRLVAPGKWMLCASFNLPKSVAYAKPTLDM